MAEPEPTLDELCQLHNTSPDSELEMRFGTRGRHVDHISFDRIVSKLKGEGFERQNQIYMLRIQTEFLDPKSGNMRLSNVRITIKGLDAIQAYCKTGDITGGERNEPLPGVSFELKTQFKRADGAPVRPLDMPEWNMRMSLQKEEMLLDRDGRVKQVLSEWGSSRKVYRLIKRFVMVHASIPVQADLSVVRSSATNRRGRMIPVTNYAEARVSDQSESFEVELEVVRHLTTSPAATAAALRKTSKCILSAMQDSNYPITKSEQERVAIEYYTLIHGEPPGSRIRPRDFIGPSSVSLELPNINAKSDAKITVLENYAVTDKADGLRKLLYAASSGKLYFIDTNMNVQYTGLVVDSSWANTLVDGEHIVHDKFGAYYDVYAAFDCYFLKGKDIRTDHLVTADGKGGRLASLSGVVSGMSPTTVVAGARQTRVVRKTFYAGENVFANCNKVAKVISEGGFTYETDGMMLTPINLGVGMQPGDTDPVNRKKTWSHSFKWKPPEQNTIDFLCTSMKEADGSESVKTIFTGGQSMESESSLTQYKSYVLRVGYDEKAHGYLNPCQMVLDGDYPRTKQSDRQTEYRPAPFNPTNPSDPSASLCNVLVDTATGLTMTEDKRGVIDDATIIECRYDPKREAGWRWVPIKNRYDKTADMRSGGRNYGNAYHVAESVWTSIHNPVTLVMLTTGQSIPEVSSDAYYLAAGASLTSPMRDFHNIVVKRKILKAVIRPGNLVLDLGAGKAGDLHKWIASRAGLVVGIDSCRDCIENRTDGACARYLNAHTTYKAVPPMFFLYGEASEPIRDGAALLTAGGKRTMRALLGEGPRDSEALGEAVYRNYGKAKNGFDVISCQFALHYFFRDLPTFEGLLANVVSMCTAGGYFVGTCYDGKRVFRALEDKALGDGLCLSIESTAICEITKQYDNTGYRDDETCLGYAIDVYQDSINNQIREYLVNFAYLEKRLAEHGVRALTVREAKGLGLLGGITPFGDLYQQMQLMASKDRRFAGSIGAALAMSDPEKQVSFLNNMFVFKMDGGAKASAPKTKARTQRKLQVVADSNADGVKVD